MFYTSFKTLVMCQNMKYWDYLTCTDSLDFRHTSIKLLLKKQKTLWRNKFYLSSLRFSPTPLDLILKHCPVEIFKKELHIAAVVQTPAVDTRAQWKTPACLLDSHTNIGWQWLSIATRELKYYLPFPYLQKIQLMLTNGFFTSPLKGD